ncbi:MAG: hypothetical protein ABIJ40_16305 [Bacteroidota bacterium]
MGQAEERIKDYMENLDQNYAEFMNEESKEQPEPTAKSSVDCRVINFLRTYWGYYKGNKTMIARSNYDKMSVELRRFDTHGNIVGSEHFSRKKIIDMINEGVLKVEKH